MKKVTVLTATTGRQDLTACIRSVYKQTHRPIEHIVVVDGPDARDHYLNIDYWKDNKDGYWGMGCDMDKDYKLEIVILPKSIGKDRWNGHRIYAAGTYMADGDYVCFLDDDNTFEPNHIESLVSVIEKGFRDWSYSLRNIVDLSGNKIDQDNCESLGKWVSVCGGQDYFIDVNCFMLPVRMAVEITPHWYHKFREPGKIEVDRMLTYVLRRNWQNFDSNYQYTVNYKVGNSPLSVQAEFFKQGNAAMLQRYNGKLPWVKSP